MRGQTTIIALTVVSGILCIFLSTASMPRYGGPLTAALILGVVFFMGAWNQFRRRGWIARTILVVSAFFVALYMLDDIWRLRYVIELEMRSSRTLRDQTHDYRWPEVAEPHSRLHTTLRFPRGYGVADAAGLTELPKPRPSALIEPIAATKLICR